MNVAKMQKWFFLLLIEMWYFRISATTLVHLVGSPLPMSGSTNNKSTTNGWMDEVTLQA